MKTITIKNVGNIREVVELQLNKFNIFTGSIGSGKYAIIKIINFCLMVEEEVVTGYSFTKSQKDKYHFLSHIERFHKMRGYFSSDSYVHYKSDKIEIILENGECLVSCDGKYGFQNNKIVYIPSERNMVVLPEARKVEFGNTNIRSFLFNWFDARMKYSKVNKFPILNLDFSYYYNEGSDDDRVVLDNGLDISLSSAPSGLKSLIPLLVTTEYLTKVVQGEDITSFEIFEKERHFKDGYKQDESNILNVDYTISLPKFEKLKTTHITIEEPEDGLSPDVQRELIKWLIDTCSKNTCSGLVLSTNSPYILYTINNCMLAWSVGEKYNGTKLNPNNVGIWVVEDDKIKSLKSTETGLLGGNPFNDEMQKIYEEMFQLLRMKN